MESLDSAITKPVISLVKEAMGKTAWSFLRYNTSWVSWSTTRATLECRSSASDVACKPAICPKEARTGRACCALWGLLRSRRACFTEDGDFLADLPAELLADLWATGALALCTALFLEAVLLALALGLS